MENGMETRQIVRAEQENAGLHAQWISGRVETLLAHYFQPENPAELQEAAIDDWIAMLLPFSKQAIEAACSDYLRNEARRRPTPGSIVVMAESASRRLSRQQHSSGDQDLSENEARVAHFSEQKGWMPYANAKQVIQRSRQTPMPNWIKTTTERSLFAVRHDPLNRKLINGVDQERDQ